jgi:hypothetical protein
VELTCLSDSKPGFNLAATCNQEKSFVAQALVWHCICGGRMQTLVCNFVQFDQGLSSPSSLLFKTQGFLAKILLDTFS